MSPVQGLCRGNSPSGTALALQIPQNLRRLQDGAKGLPSSPDVEASRALKRSRIHGEPVLRISSVSAVNGQRQLKVEGRLVGEFANELSRVAAEVLAETPMKLDLADVTFVDSSGARVLRALRDRGVELLHPSEFLLALMNGEEP